MGLTKKPDISKQKSLDAAMVVSKQVVKEVSTDKGNKKIWKVSEIGKLKPWEFEKFEKEIDQARSEGRVDFNK